MTIIINNNTLDGSSSPITIASGTLLSSNYASGTPAAGQATSATPVYAPGRIIGVTHFQNSTRTALSASTSYTLWSAGNVYKKISTSKLIITGQLVFSNGSSYNMGYWWQIGSSGQRYDGIMQVNHNSDTNKSVSIKLGWYINQEYSTTATGNLAVSIGWQAVDGSSNTPGSVWNPNASDDPRSQQHTSDIKIFEVTQ